MIKEISIQIQVKHLVIDNLIEQQFIILSSKRLFRYLVDKRFKLYNDFSKKMKEFALSTKDFSFIFIGKNDLMENKISLYYENNNKELPNDFYFTLSDFVPSTFGCSYYSFCIREETENHIYCGFFTKIVKKRKGSCKYFKQRSLFKT